MGALGISRSNSSYASDDFTLCVLRASSSDSGAVGRIHPRSQQRQAVVVMNYIELHAVNAFVDSRAAFAKVEICGKLRLQILAKLISYIALQSYYSFIVVQ